jgi:hypothetical protein
MEYSFQPKTVWSEDNGYPDGFRSFKLDGEAAALIRRLVAATVRFFAADVDV